MGPRFRKHLPPVALVVGTCAPDFAYLFGGQGPASHVPLGILTFCVPMGAIFYLWLELLVLPALAQTLPSFLKLELPALLRPRGLPNTLKGWAGVVAALAIGSATHLLWDGFTHNWMWPAVALYPDTKVPLFGRVYPIARVFQYACHIFGGAVVIAWGYRHYANERAPWLPSLRAIRPWLLALAIPAVLAFTLRLQTWRPVSSIEQSLWLLFWPTVGGMILGTTAYAFYLRLRGEGAALRA